MPLKRTIKNQKIANLVFGAADIITTLVTLIIAALITNTFTSEQVIFDDEFVLIALIIILLWVLLLKSTHLARIPRTSAIPIILGDFVRLTLIGGALVLLIDYLVEFDNFPALTLAIFVLLNMFSLSALRLLTFKFFKLFRANGHNTRNVIVIGNENCGSVIDKIATQKEWGFNILHIITDSKIIRDQYSGIAKVFPKSANVKSLIRYDIVDELICCDCIYGEDKLFNLIEFCLNLGVTVRIKSDIIQAKRYKTRIQYFDRIPFLTYESSPQNKFSHSVKYVFELFVASLIMFAASPFILLVIFLIKLSSKGPVLVKQARVGLHCRKFYAFKFSTSKHYKLARDKKRNSSGFEPQFKSSEGYNRIGKFLEKSHLDQIPMLINVIRGEMSIIGPRPPLPHEVDGYREWQLKKLSVKPGLISIWNIIDNETNSNPENMIMMDIQYINEWSLKNDLGLFFKSFKANFFDRRA